MSSSRFILVPGTASERSKSPLTQSFSGCLFVVLTRCPRSLAYVEMRLILARVIWNFDLKLADDSKDWISRQKVFLLWQKGPLNVYLTPRAKE